MPDTIETKKIIQSLSNLNNQRTDQIFSLVHCKPLVHGLPHKVYRKCGKKNCNCAQGKLHGPYHALSVNKYGKKTVVMVKKADTEIIIKRAKRYQYFQKKLAQIRKINREIDSLLEKLKSLTIRDYP